jgi:mgtE-like transporter
MAYPWILAIFPLVLTVRGDISGVLSGKVGTMLHTDEIRPQLRGNTRVFHSLLSSILVLTFVDTIGVGLLSFVFNIGLQQTSLQHLVYFVVIPTLTCVLSVMIAIPITLFVAIKAFKSGLNPDIIVYPIMSTTNDVLISVIYVAIVSIMLMGGVYVVFMEAVIVIIALASTILFIGHIREGLFKKTLKEGLILE